MSEAERLIRGLLELLDVVLHSGQVPKATELLLEDVRMVRCSDIGREGPASCGVFFHRECQPRTWRARLQKQH